MEFSEVDITKRATKTLWAYRRWCEEFPKVLLITNNHRRFNDETRAMLMRNPCGVDTKSLHCRYNETLPLSTWSSYTADLRHKRTCYWKTCRYLRITVFTDVQPSDILSALFSPWQWPIPRKQCSWLFKNDRRQWKSKEMTMQWFRLLFHSMHLHFALQWLLNFDQRWIMWIHQLCFTKTLTANLSTPTVSYSNVSIRNEENDKWLKMIWNSAIESRPLEFENMLSGNVQWIKKFIS